MKAVKDSNHTLKGFHHYYIGLVLLLLGFWLVWKSLFISYILCVSGLTIIIDDYFQHVCGKTNPKYKSPLHRLYGWFYSRSSFIRKLNYLFDKVFGK
jgi:hypothetical protein